MATNQSGHSDVGNGGRSEQLGIRLRLQRLAITAQVLAVGALAVLHSEDNTFATSEIAALYERLRIPPPRNISAVLGRHAEQARLVRPTAGRWAFTPEGEAHLKAITAEVSATALAVEIGTAPAAELAERRHALIPPFLAPAGMKGGLSRLLASTSFETNVMLITRFPADENDPRNEVVKQLRAVCGRHGLNLLLACDGNAEDTLWSNVVTYMWGSQYGIVIVDSADGVLNSNVLIEVGGMLMTGRRCAILKDRSVPTMPTDLVGHIYKSVDLAEPATVAATVHTWLRDDLGLSPCTECPQRPDL